MIKKNKKIFKGKIEHTLKGFAFLICEDKNVKDIFISKTNLLGAMDGDIVLVETLHCNVSTTEKMRQEGKVVEILERKNTKIVGTFQIQSKCKYGFVIADDKKIRKDIFVPMSWAGRAKNDDKVVVEIIKWETSKNKNPEGKIIEILGNKDKKGIDILSVIKKFGISEKFNKNTLKEAKLIPQKVSDIELKNRVDLRNELIVTIDGKDSKDLDDAVSIERLKNGNFKLGVHIADVAHYVKEGSFLDNTAFERATSTYLIDTVVPMLPEELSNGICSLNPNVERLTLSCIMQVDKKGKVLKYEICESVINTKHRLVYSDVSDILEAKKKDKFGLLDKFELMQELALILKDKRYKRGSIDFNFVEPYIVLDNNGKPIDVKLRDIRIANKIIEEFMILANETVAEYVNSLDLPFIYRIHEIPDEEKIVNFNKFLFNLGFQIKGSLKEIHPRDLQNIQKKIAGKPEEDIISKLMLRSLRQAKYSEKNEGHFGLASEFYCHFTSPIRRYPDLIVHRVLKDILHKRMQKQRIEALANNVKKIAGHASEKSRISEKAEYDVYDMKMAEFMQDKIGEVFEGTISSVVKFGLFVELDNRIEGLVKVENLKNDYYVFDENSMCLIGNRTKKKFKIGDKIIVLVAGVNVERREIDFEIVR